MTTLDRRGFLRTGLAAAAVAGGALAVGAAPVAATPAFKPGGRPVLTHGVQSGDPAAHSAVVWTRADRIGRMRVESLDRPGLASEPVVGSLVTAPDRRTGRDVRFVFSGDIADLTVNLRDQAGSALWSTTLTA